MHILHKSCTGSFRGPNARPSRLVQDNGKIERYVDIGFDNVSTCMCLSRFLLFGHATR